MSRSVHTCGEPDFSSSPLLPVRSILFSLSPVGLGTPRQESLLSLLVRTSRAHAIGPRQLVKDVLAEIDPGITRIASAVFFRSLSVTVNGLGAYAERFVTVLECATGQTGLRHLTMLPWKGLFPHNGQGCLVRRPRWCPACLADAVSSGETVTVPLAWSLEAYRVCPIHKIALEGRCLHCGKEQPFIPQHPDLAACDHCGRSLVGARVAGPCDASDVWMACAVADMVGQKSKLEAMLTAEVFRKHVREHVAAATDGNRAAYCRMLGINIRGLNGWLTKGERPSMAQFLTFCYGADLLPTSMLSGICPPRAVAPPRALRSNINARRSCRRLKYSERLDLERRLRSCLEWEVPRPISEIARKFGVRPGLLRYWFRDFCQQISERYRFAVNERSAAYHAQQCGIVEQIIGEVRSEGCYPSRRLVNQRLRLYGMALAQSHLLATYCKIVHTEKTELL